MVKPFEPDEVVTKVRSLIGSTANEHSGAV
jgi:hypothetical protein